jgi:hypothetical protein
VVLTRNFSQSLILQQEINRYWVKELTPKRLLRPGSLLLNPKELTTHRVVMMFLRMLKIVKVSLDLRELKLPRRARKNQRKRNRKMI